MNNKRETDSQTDRKNHDNDQQMIAALLAEQQAVFAQTAEAVKSNCKIAAQLKQISAGLDTMQADINKNGLSSN